MIKKLNNKGFTQILSFIMLFPLIFVFIISMAQITIIGLSQVVVNDAAFEGARAAAKNPYNITGAAYSKVLSFGQGILPNWTTKTSIAVAYTGTSPGSEVTVTVTYEFPKYNYFAYVLNLGNTFKAVTGKSTQIIEELP